MRWWNTVYARDYDCAGDLVWEISQKIDEIKKRDKKVRRTDGQDGQT